MRRSLPSSLDSLDRDARDLAKAAARRAGLTLEEWSAQVLAGDRSRDASSFSRRAPADDPLDSLIGRMAQMNRRPRSDYELLMEAAAESDREAKEQASRTAVALESMAGWIEQAEERLAEAERAGADQQDRITAALSHALSTLKDRLDSVERQVVAERAAPARIEFPVQDAVKVLAPLSDHLVGLRQDLSQLADKWDQPTAVVAGAVENIRGEIETLRGSLDGLATRDELTALTGAVHQLARRFEEGGTGKDLMTVAHAVTTLYQKVQGLSGELSEGIHRRLGQDIDLIKNRIEEAARSGVDRSVIDFLSSQIVDLRQDLAQRAEPQQLARLSDDVEALGRQIAELRESQVSGQDLSSLKASLEQVCALLQRSADDVPERLQSLSDRLDLLVARPEAEPADLGAISEQLAAMTDHMARLSSSRIDESDSLARLIERVSLQVQATHESGAQHEPVMERFDRLEEELRRIAQPAPAADVAALVRSLESKLDRQPEHEPTFEALEQRIGALVEQVASKATPATSDDAVKALQTEAGTIAEQAAKAALKDLEAKLPGSSDIDALKQAFVELKAVQTRSDSKTHQTLRAVHEALETLVARFPEYGSALQTMGTAPQPERMPPADRLEAAVRRLHTATLNQMEEAAAPSQDFAPSANTQPLFRQPRRLPSPAGDELSSLRAGLIAAARRAAHPNLVEPEEPADETSDEPASRNPSEPASLMDRLKRAFDTHRRPLLPALAFLILAPGAFQIVTSAYRAPAPGAAIAAPAETAVAVATPEVHDIQLARTDTAAAVPPRFMVDPQTVGELPGDLPAALRQAAEAGDASALYDIALRAFEGREMAPDPALAARLFERAAQAGLPPAQERYAMLHDKGIGVPRDVKLAIAWYERAALGGNVRAMHNLATLLAAGATGKPDYAAAMRWYREAAEAGLKDSQFNMGILFARGVGTKQDLAKAYKWFALAAAQGDGDAARKRDDIAAKLAASDLAAEKAGLERWRPRAVDPVANEGTVLPTGRTAALEPAPGGRI